MKYAALMAFLACLSLTSTPVLAQGYDGLFAPADEKSTGADDGYGSSVPDAAPIQEKPPAATRKPQAPTTRPQMTRQPYLPDTTVNDAKQLQLQAKINELAHGNSSLAAQLSRDIAKNKNAYIAPERVDGLLPMEKTTKDIIDSLLSIVSNENLPLEQRKQNAKTAYNQLLEFSDGIKARRKIPDDTYLRAGAAPEFVRDQKEANEKSLIRLEAALKILKPLQR